MHVQMTVHNVFRIRLRFERQIPVVAGCNNLRQRSPIIDKNRHQTLRRLLLNSRLLHVSVIPD